MFLNNLRFFILEPVISWMWFQKGAVSFYLLSLSFIPAPNLPHKRTDRKSKYYVKSLCKEITKNALFTGII